jgi:hypothetical protein
MARHPSAFINVIAQGRHFSEALYWLQDTWDELQDERIAHKETRERLERVFSLLRSLHPENYTDQL